MFRTNRLKGAGRGAAALRRIGVALIGLTVTACSETLVEAPPPQVVFENELFRILDMDLPPGATVAHASMHDVALISMSQNARTSIQLDGDWTETADQSLGAINVVAMPDGPLVRNAGETDHQLFAIENLRNDQEPESEPLSDDGVTLAGESPELRAYDVRLGEKTFQVSHVHDVPTVAVLVGGRIISQGGEIKEGPGSDAPTGVKQLEQPGQWVYVPPGESHYVVRLGTTPVHVVEIELR